MAVRLNKPWRDLTTENLGRVTGHLGVYQLANDAGEILYIGVAGGRTRFGLKGEIAKMLDAPPTGVTKFRFEVNMAYRTRFAELVEAFQFDHGKFPEANTDIDPRMFGRLRPGGGPG
jgi:hypothetical protein